MTAYAAFGTWVPTEQPSGFVNMDPAPGAGFAERLRIAEAGAGIKMHIPGFFQDGECPAPSCGERGQVGTIIPHLNDDHQWTYGQIADWLETLPNMEVHQDAQDLPREYVVWAGEDWAEQVSSAEAIVDAHIKEES